VSLNVQSVLLAAFFEPWKLNQPEILAHDFGGATAMCAWGISTALDIHV
jgi:hypothetical protein